MTDTGNLKNQLAAIREVCDALIGATYTAEHSHDELEELLVSKEVVQSDLNKAYAELVQIWHRRECAVFDNTLKTEATVL